MLRRAETQTRSRSRMATLEAGPGGPSGRVAAASGAPGALPAAAPPASVTGPRRRIAFAPTMNRTKLERFRPVRVFQGKILPTLPGTSLLENMNTQCPLAEPLWSKELAVPFRLIPGSLEVQSAGLSFQCDHDGNTILCGVSGDVLHDLLAFHRLESSGGDAFRALPPELERLAMAKLLAGRLEENGMLIIRDVDLLRYGFQAKPTACSQSDDVTTNPPDDVEGPLP